MVSMTQLPTHRVITDHISRTAESCTEKVVSNRIYSMQTTRTIQLSHCKSSAFKSYERSRTLCTSPPSASTQAHTVHHGEHAAMLHGAPSHASPAHHACSRSRCGRHASAIARGPAVHHPGAREHGLGLGLGLGLACQQRVLFPRVFKSWRSRTMAFCWTRAASRIYSLSTASMEPHRSSHE